MSCYHPIKRFVYGFKKNKKTGELVDGAVFYPAYIRHRFGVVDYSNRRPDLRLQEVHFLARNGFKGPWSPWCDVSPPVADECLSEFDVVRCGKCIGCRMDKSADWANRLLLEKEYYPDDQCYFLTLTYDDVHAPRVYVSDHDTGEALPVLTLSRRDIQLFVKRLRKRLEPQKIRVFYCGEYGPQTFRPHYHMIVFGLQLGDLVPYGRGEAGFMYYQSNFLTSVWAERKAPTRHGSVTPLSSDFDYFCTPYGRLLVSPASWNTFAYVSRYTVKKLYGAEARAYDALGIEPPFLGMSTDPGIGKQWYLDHPEYKDFEYISVKTPQGGKKFRPPHYFDTLYDAEEPEKMAEIKEARKRLAEEFRRVKEVQTSLTFGELLELSERQFKDRIKPLKRSAL
ncbi:replication initiator protein [Dipodfec virus UOA04_Rod_843]|nr:replication initiator protein [Dipodfec virus UOA04_Rod_843]